MPAASPWGNDELQALVSDPESRVCLDQKRISVALQPFHLQDLKSAVRELLNATVDRYDKSLDGILLSFKHLKVLSKSASVTAETSAVIIDIQADFYVFRPTIGCILRGVVNKISQDHVGVLLYHRFNVSCPRPGSDAKSKKWIGSNVVMRQEVIFKLKDKNFNGTLPFFLGKIMDIGTIVNDKEEKKSLKKKSKEVTLENSNVSELPESPSGESKKRKHKLEETDHSLEVKLKKSKKNDAIDKSEQQFKGDASVLQLATDSSTTKKKKKKTSIGSKDETDFIPRFSLDVSQLPEHLPPPDANSTHFDLTKNLSSVGCKSEKKKKTKNAGLDSIREESSEGLKGVSSTNIQNEIIGQAKTKKKRESDQSNTVPFDNKALTESAKNVSESPKKKKQTSVDPVLKSKKSINTELQLTPPASPKKKHKAQEALAEVEETVPKKGKKSLQLSHDQERSKDKSKANIVTEVPEKNVDFQSPIKSKKKSKEDLLNTSSSKVQKEKKDKTIVLTAKVDLGSDDTIPPGQKYIRESPKKQSDTPVREKSLSSGNITKSPGISYFAPSSIMMDLDISSRKGPRQGPLMYGNLEGKILPPPESPMKSPPSKNARMEDSDSDSDAQSMKKVVVSSSLPQESSDSSDSETNKRKQPLKRSAASSDESDSDASVKRLLQSMGVMQSPLKTAKPNVKHDTSGSESDGNSDVEGNNSSTRLVVPAADRLPQPKSLKPILGAKSKPESVERTPSSKKSFIDNKNSSKATMVSPSKGKDSSQSAVRPENSESDSDSDLEMMKAAMLKMDQERRSAASKPNPKSKAKPLKSVSESDNVLSKKAQAASEKKSVKPNDKISLNSRTTTAITSTKNSLAADSSNDSSNTELKQAASSKNSSKQDIKSKAKKSKSNVENDNVDVAAKKKSKGKPEKKVSDISSVDSRTLNNASKNLGNVGSDSDDSDTELLKSSILKMKESEQLVGTSVLKNESKSKQVKSKAGLSDADLLKAVMSKINEEQQTGRTSKPKQKSKPKQDSSKSENKDIFKKNASSSDSDSGPDDRNTSDMMKNRKNKGVVGVNSKKKKISDKESIGLEKLDTKLMPTQSIEKSVESINGSKSRKKKESKTEKASESISNDKLDKQKVLDKVMKPVKTKKVKSTKGETDGKKSGGDDSASGKKAAKEKKKKGVTDDEISDVMQRLLRQAQLSVGLQ